VNFVDVIFFFFSGTWAGDYFSRWWRDGKMFHSRDVRYTWELSHVFAD